MRLAIQDDRFLDRENKNLEGNNPAIRAATIIFPLASSTYSISLLNLNI